MQRPIMPEFTPATLRPYLPVPGDSHPNHPTWWVGFSGGLDSTVLLHALVQLNLPVHLRALHVNHQISPNADSWQRQCAALCARWGVEFVAEKVSVINAGKGIEDAARRARYQVFERQLGQGDVLLTAHHANDQAETLMLRLMRGAGPRGLAAIAGERLLPGGGRLIRPLLAFSRAELEAYAHTQQLLWVDDESNRDDHYDRNFLRNQVIPLLQARWPALMRKWQQTADLCARQEALLEEYAREDFAHANARTERVGESIDLAWLKKLSPTRRQHLLRYWLRLAKVDAPELAHWQQFEAQLFAARADAHVRICWGGYALQPYRDRLFLLPVNLPEFELDFVRVEGEGPGESLATKHKLRADLPDIHLRQRTGGERCKPEGRHHSQQLKKLLQEYELEPWLRDRVPLVFSGDTLVAVGDLWVCSGYAAPTGEAGLQLVWQARV